MKRLRLFAALLISSLVLLASPQKATQKGAFGLLAGAGNDGRASIEIESLAANRRGGDDGIKAAVIEGIRIYLSQIEGSCFASEFSIGNISKFEAAVNTKVNKFIVGQAGADWLKANSPSANSSHYAWRGVGRTADIIFRFDPRDANLSMTQRQTMMHEVTHHIEWLKGVKLPSSYKTPITGTVTRNPSSERNTEFQDQAINAIVKWIEFDKGIKEKRMPLGQGMAAWKDLESALLQLEKGTADTGNKKHDANLKELTGFDATFDDIKNYYLNNKCGDDFRILVYLAEVAPRLDWRLDVEGPEEMTLGDEIVLKTAPFDSVGGPVTLKPELNAKLRWHIPRREEQVGESINFRPTEAISYPITVDLTVPFMGENRVIAHGERTVKVNPEATPTPTETATASPTVTPTPTGSGTVEFGGNVPGIWDGGKNPQGFDFKRKQAEMVGTGECKWNIRTAKRD